MGTAVRREEGHTGNPSAVSETWRGWKEGLSTSAAGRVKGYSLTAPENLHCLLGDVEM